jgi:DNA-directed RNA polymerase specialized sigma subunit
VTKEHFDQYEKNIEQNINEILKQLGRKSSIKDVCALLDMKSNTEEVNKALDEIHSEMDKVLVTKTELTNHLQE